VAPNDVAMLKQQIKIASKRNRSRQFVAITWTIAQTFDTKNSERPEKFASANAFGPYFSAIPAARLNLSRSSDPCSVSPEFSVT
jgi:hypothetical protein